MAGGIKLQRPRLIATFVAAQWLSAATAYALGFSRAAGPTAFTISHAALLILAGVVPPLLLLIFIYSGSARENTRAVAQAYLRLQKAIFPTEPDETSVGDWLRPDDVPPRPPM